MRYLIQRHDGQFLIRDDEFTPHQNEACHFDDYDDAEASAADDEIIVCVD